MILADSEPAGTPLAAERRLMVPIGSVHAGEAGVVRIAAVSDIHCTKTSQGVLQPLFAQMAGVADVIVLAGDLVDYGLPEEAQVLVKELAPVLKMPVLAVLGNHDFESDKAEQVATILCDAGVEVLDGDSREVLGIGFAGVKGFGGGFGRRALEPWGEQAIKAFVQEGVQESLRLESALARLRVPKRIAILHYAPIAATVEGEPLEIWPFLGSSRLEDPLNRHEVCAAFHGHAHHGAPEGATSAGIPVYNVAMPLLQRSYPDRPPFRVLNVQVDEPAGTAVRQTEAAISSRV